MSFLYPQVLITLLLPALLAAGYLMAWRRRKQSAQLLVSPKHPELIQARPIYRTLLPNTLALLALAGILCALARPINGYEPGEGTASGRNLLIALDISRSMETQDVKPSRLEEARAAAYELIEALPTDKIGLIVFSGEADLVVPLTYDHTALRDTLEQVNRGWAGYGGTNFGLLLRCALRTFARNAPDGANALVILSDGEDTVESSPNAVEEAKKNNMLVITVGIGTPTGAPIPDPEGENNLWQNADGKHVISKLDVKAMQNFAQSTGGSFLTMNSGADLTAFARETAEKLARHEESYAIGNSPRDLFAWFAFPSLLLIIIAILLRSEWRVPRKLMPVLFLLCHPVSANAAEETAIPTPAEAYEAGLHAMQSDKTSEAQRLLSDALLSKDSTLQAAAHLALGNMQTRAIFDRLRQLYEVSPDDTGETTKKQPSPEELQSIVDELKKCLARYKDALHVAPQFVPAQNNAAKLRELIKKLEEEIERLKQQQQQQQQQQQHSDQQDQDQQQQKQNKDRNQNQGESNDRQDQRESENDQQEQGRQNQQDSGEDQRDEEEEQGKNQQQQGKQAKEDQQNQGNEQDQKNPQDAQQPQNDQQQDQTNSENQQWGQRQDQQSKDQRQQPSGSDKGDQQVQAAELSEEEKDKQRAAGILRMHTDEMGGSPIPHRDRPTRPPDKDY